jgi:hypothetical protein
MLLLKSCPCFGLFLCPSSAVYSLYTQQWYMSYRHCTHSCRAGTYAPAQKLSMFRTVPLSIIRSLFTVHSAMVYVIQALYTQLSSRSICSCSKAVHVSDFSSVHHQEFIHCTLSNGICHTGTVHTAVWHIPSLSVQWINSWWWTEELSERCRVSCQNKLVKLVHLVGFIKRNWPLRSPDITSLGCVLPWWHSEGHGPPEKTADKRTIATRHAVCWPHIMSRRQRIPIWQVFCAAFVLSQFCFHSLRYH